MSLRGHPKEAAAISPSLSVPTITRRLLRRCAPRNDMTGGALFLHVIARPSPMSLSAIPFLLYVIASVAKQSLRPHSYLQVPRDCFVAALLAKTRLVAPFSPCHCPPLADQSRSEAISHNSSYKLRHSLFTLFTNLIFFSLEPAFICFSLKIALSISLHIS